MVQCDPGDLPQQILDADVVVPLMCAIPAGLMAAAPRLKLVIQYGVGVEAIDAAAVRAPCQAIPIGSWAAAAGHPDCAAWLVLQAAVPLAAGCRLYQRRSRATWRCQ